MKRLGGQIRVCGGICRDGVDLLRERSSKKMLEKCFTLN